MQQSGYRRRASVIAAAAIIALTAGVGAFEFFEITLDPITLEVNQFLKLTPIKDSNTGFDLRSRNGSPLILNSTVIKYDPASAWNPDIQVQEGFVLLDGTLSLDVDAMNPDGTRARMLTTYRLDVRRGWLRREHLARSLVRQGVVRDLTRARTRARSMRLEDARVMRLVEREGGARWMRAVRAMRETREREFRGRKLPDGVLGHFGFAQPATGDPYVWAVMDRNSRYAVGLTIDRDGDGVPNSADNCVGTANANQGDADADGAGNDCDLDDDNDAVADTTDNCPLQANEDQADQDLDGAGNACDLDDDNDNVLDGADKCPATAFGSTVAADGCSIADSCPCETSWRNHGAYVKCVAQTSNGFLSAGLITSAQKDAIVSAAAQSSCGF
jgi:hypothetical protein